MAVITAVEHYVREDVLRKWLKSQFGAEDIDWFMEQIAGGKPGTWKVTAPMAISESKQIELANESQPKKARTFGRKS